MQTIEGRLLISATDLSDFLACEHLAHLKLRRAHGEDIPTDEDAMSAILSRLGSEHEQTCLERFRLERPRVREFDEERTLHARTIGELEAAAAETVAAMREGYDVIYQPFFLDGSWSGRADFLLRVDEPSALGAHSYEVADAKLARRVRAQAILQLCEYSHHVAGIQGREPAQLHVLLGTQELRSYPLSDFSAYHHHVRDRLQRSVAADAWSTYPERIAYCGFCRFRTVCDEQRHADDHLSIVARMRRDQVRRLNDAGITTAAELALMPANARVANMVETTLAGLRLQAALQKAGPYPDGRPRHELLDVDEPGSGLAGLPEPAAGDVFFDMEGDPLARDEPLEYLFGVSYRDGDGLLQYRCWEGHTRAGEKRAFEDFVDWVIERLDRYPGMHVYHYADYERAALQRLMSRHGSRENEVDRLLRDEVLVDLYRVVSQGVRLSTESYGLKSVEHLYRPQRAGDVADAAGSMVVYEQWRNSGDDPGSRDRALIDSIIAYNRDDCESTEGLRAWLEAQRGEWERVHGRTLPRPVHVEREEKPEEQRRTEEEEALRTALVAGVPDDPVARQADEDLAGRWLLGQLVGYHHRERRSAFWRYFRKLEMTEDELAEDRDALGPLTHVRREEDENKRIIDVYAFEPQEHHLSDDVCDPLLRNEHGERTGVRTGRVDHIDDRHGLLHLRRNERQAELAHPRFVVASGPIPTEAQAQAVRDFGDAVVGHGFDAPGWQVASNLLRRRPPQPERPGMPLQLEGESVVDAALRLLRECEWLCLPVQGPPGAGKTYAAARIAIERARFGPVAVTALSHRAITNVLDEICKLRPAGLRVGQLIRGEARCCAEDLIAFRENPQVTRALDEEGVDVVGGTSFLFARPEMSERFDTLIIDEAGQMSLADAIAMSRCARRLVLLGDPRQLAQVVQGIHPDGAAASALEHVLGDELTIAPDRGLFLDRTRRMCRPLTEFISSAFYESRLEADPQCDVQEILTPLGGLRGVRRVPVVHPGDRTSSEAEAEAVAAIVNDLIGLSWRDHEGRIQPLTLEDILVVAPYNAHVACLVRHLPEGARVGTVDRFQGQEAAVSIFSMATSSTDDLPRNLEFLFSLNRLNVALSRARCLAIVVHSPLLTQARCRTPEQMRLVNALCRYELAAPLWTSPRAAAVAGADARQLQLIP